jgi:hypothetical protein
VIDSEGNFTWTESSADCQTRKQATGFLWVEGTQVLMQVETWEWALPWDTQTIAGETFAAPFRLRMGFTIQADYLAFAGPPGLTETETYLGRSWVLQSQDMNDNFIAGSWRAEAELIGIPASEGDPVVVLRDVFTADLEPDADAVTAPDEGVGTLARVQTYYFTTSGDAELGDQVFDPGNWTCTSDCDLSMVSSGTTFINGANTYTFGPYAGVTHLMSFTSGTSFRRDIASGCN